MTGILTEDVIGAVIVIEIETGKEIEIETEMDGETESE